MGDGSATMTLTAIPLRRKEPLWSATRPAFADHFGCHPLGQGQGAHTVYVVLVPPVSDSLFGISLIPAFRECDNSNTPVTPSASGYFPLPLGDIGRARPASSTPDNLPDMAVASPAANEQLSV